MASSIARRTHEERVLANLLSDISAVDEKRVSRELIAFFGDLGGVLSAPLLAQIRTARGDLRVVRRLRLVRQAMLLALRCDLTTRRSVSTQSAVLDYLRLWVGREPCEHVVLLLIDSKLRLIRADCLFRGEPTEGQVCARDVVTRGLEAGATGLILAHNHPSGMAEPSKADIEITYRVRSAAHATGLSLFDHLIVTRTGHYSFRAARQL